MKYLLMSRGHTLLFGWSTPFTLLLVTLVVSLIGSGTKPDASFSSHPSFLLIRTLMPRFTWSLPCSSSFQEEIVSSFWLSIVYIVCVAWGAIMYSGQPRMDPPFWAGPKEGIKEEAYKEVIGSTTVCGSFTQNNNNKNTSNAQCKWFIL